MPQPFQDFNMNQIENWNIKQFQQEAKKMNMSDKIGDLAHFLVQHFRDELSPDEHVVDTATRLLQRLTPVQDKPSSDVNDFCEPMKPSE